jgi:hypothetical protein
MLRRVALVRTDVSEERSATFIRVTRIGELGTMLAVTSNRCTLVFLRSVSLLLVTASVIPSSPIFVTLMKEALSSSETLVLTRSTRHNIPEDTVLHSHCSENLKSDMFLFCEWGLLFNERWVWSLLVPPSPMLLYSLHSNCLLEMMWEIVYSAFDLQQVMCLLLMGGVYHPLSYSSFSQTLCSQMTVRLSTLLASCPFSHEDSYYSLLLEADSTPGLKH